MLVINSCESVEILFRVHTLKKKKKKKKKYENGNRYVGWLLLLGRVSFENKEKNKEEG